MPAGPDRAEPRRAEDGAHQPTGRHDRPGPPPDIEDSDPGLARARTELAWIRTAISFSAVGAAVLRWHIVAGGALLLVGALIWLVGRHAARVAGEPPWPDATARLRQRRLGLVTLATVIVAVTALVLTFLVPGHPTW